MAKYRIQAPDGQTYEIEGPEGATDDQVRAEVLRQHPAAAAAASANAQSFDGGSDAAPTAPSAPQTAAPQLNVAKSPTAAVTADPGLQPSETETRFGDGAGASGPNLQLTPEENDHLLHILATDPIEKAAANARAYVKARGYNFQDNFDTVIDQRRKGEGVGGNMAYGAPGSLDPRGNSSVRAGLEGAADSSTLGAAPKILSGIDATSVALGMGGQGDPNQSWWNNYRGTLDSIEGQRKSDRGEHPWLYGAGALAGGAVLPTGIWTAAERAGFEAGANALRSGATREEARILANIAARRAATGRAAVEGAGYGAGTGALSADSPQDALTGAIAGGVTGGALGAGTVGLGGLLVRPSTGARGIPLTDGQEVMAAADRLGIDPLPADVAGPTTRRATSAMAQTMVGGAPIINRSTQMLDQAQGVRDRIASEIGTALRPEAAGERAREGANTFIASSRTQKNGLYDLAERAAGDTRVPPTQAIAELDRNIAELSAVPGGAEPLARLQVLRDELARGDVSVAGMKKMRTVMREQFMRDGLRGSDTERRIGMVMDAAANDVTAGLNAAGRGNAARLYANADRFARERIQTIDNVLTPIIGKDGTKSGEAIAKSLMGDLQGNNGRAVRFLNTLPADEAGDVRASVIGGLGRATNGTQNTAGDAFSLAKFLTNYNEIGESAKRAYFGPEGRAALNDLARVAEGAKEAAKYANRSNTGGSVANLATGATGLLGFPVLAKVLVGQYAAGRLLASPRVARWLARAPRTSLTMPAYVERLSRIAKAEPALAGDILGLQRKLTDAFSGGAPLRAAANQDTQEPGIVNGNTGQDQPQTEGAQP